MNISSTHNVDACGALANYISEWEIPSWVPHLTLSGPSRLAVRWALVVIVLEFGS